ncbi:MAG: MarR family winged helix-turn-helix transcriptional regulator [Acidobacteria bacterium]|nr:MarR family winged helix-turn-helix transcriptional regulator [Acidobacteriota bacterium]MCA1608017.1 MarR family winged helix-turn-helix transcriptional regulator [Acidobacteriota bacterium]
MNFGETVSYVLTKTATSHRTALEKKMREIGLHSGQVFVLQELWKKDGQRQIDIAARLRLAPPTVNKVLGGLLEGDFVARAKYEDDARSTRIFLTPKGKEIRGLVETKWAELEDETMIELTDTERLMLSQLLRKLLERPEDLLR